MFQKTNKRRVLFSRTLTAIVLGVFSVATIVYGGFVLHTPKVFAAETNNTINFQARLQMKAGNIAPDGKYNVQFKLYDADTGGNLLWTETYYDSNGTGAGNDNRVQVSNGYLSVHLGSQTAFPSTINWDQDLYMTMNIGGTDQTATPSYDGEMDPRLKLTGVPYAFRAGQLAQYNASTGFTSSLSILQPTGGNQLFQIPDQGAAGTYTLLTQNAANTNYIQNSTSPQTADFNITGNATVGTGLTVPSIDSVVAGTLNIGTSNAATINIGGNSNASIYLKNIVHLDNNLSAVGNTRIVIGGTFSSSFTTSQYGLSNNTIFNPTGGTVSNIYGLTSLPSINGSYDVSSLYGALLRVNTESGYTGQVSTARGLYVSAPTIAGSKLFTSYYGIDIAGSAANGGNTTGTISNTQLNIQGNTAAAGTGGILNNIGLKISQPSGTGGTTNNYGLYITGNGGGNSNWSVYNSSTASSYFAGNLLVGTTANPNNYALNLVGTVSASNGYVSGSQLGQSNNCAVGQAITNTTVAGGIIVGGACNNVASTLQDAYNNSTSPASILLANGKDFTITAPDTSTDPNVLINLQCSTGCGGFGRFAVQNAGIDLFAVNPDGTVRIGGVNNNVTFNADGGYTLHGTAMHNKVIRLMPEYAGAVLDAGTGSNNTGTMTSGLDLTNNTTYYKWTTTQATNQSYDVVVSVPIPSDFSSWATNPLQVTNYTSDTTNGTITLEARDSVGGVRCNFVSVTPASTNTWTQNSTACTLSSGTYIAGGQLLLRIRMQSPAGGDVRLGMLYLTYNSNNL